MPSALTLITTNHGPYHPNPYGIPNSYTSLSRFTFPFMAFKSLTSFSLSFTGHVSPHHLANNQGFQFAPIFRPHPGHIYPQPREIPSYLHPAPSGPNQFGRAPMPINTFTQIPTLPSGPVPQSCPHPRPPFPHIGALPNGPPGPPRPPRPPGPPPADGGPWPQPGFPWNPYYQFPFPYPQAIPDGDSDVAKPDKFTGKDPRLLQTFIVSCIMVFDNKPHKFQYE